MKSLVLFCFSVLCIGAVAQTNTDSISTKSMDDVIITATRSPRLLSNIAIPASIVSAKTLYDTKLFTTQNSLTLQNLRLLTNTKLEVGGGSVMEDTADISSEPIGAA